MNTSPGIGDPAALLGKIRERAADADKAFKFGGDFSLAAARSQTDVPALLAALDEVLRLHQPKPVCDLADGNSYQSCHGRPEGSRCSSCADEDVANLWAEWPCPTALRIRAALAGADSSEKEAGDG